MRARRSRGALAHRRRSCAYARGYDPASALLAGAACGLAGAIVEAFSSHGLDNFTVQVAAAGVAALLL